MKGYTSPLQEAFTAWESESEGTSIEEQQKELLRIESYVSKTRDAVERRVREEEEKRKKEEQMRRQREMEEYHGKINGIRNRMREAEERMRREWEGLVGEMRSVDSKYVGTSIFRAPPSSVYGPPPSVSIPPPVRINSGPPPAMFPAQDIRMSSSSHPIPHFASELSPPLSVSGVGAVGMGNPSYAASVNAGNRITATSGKQDYAYFIPQPHPLQNNPPFFKREEMEGERDHGAITMERRIKRNIEEERLEQQKRKEERDRIKRVTLHAMEMQRPRVRNYREQTDSENEYREERRENSRNAEYKLMEDRLAQLEREVQERRTSPSPPPIASVARPPGLSALIKPGKITNFSGVTGSISLLDFFDKIQQCIDYARVESENDKIQCVSLYCEQRALQWFTAHRSEWSTYAQCQEAMRKEFMPSLTRWQRREMLFKIIQRERETAKLYLERLRREARVSGFIEEKEIDDAYFLGLHKELRSAVVSRAGQESETWNAQQICDEATKCELAIDIGNSHTYASKVKAGGERQSTESRPTSNFKKGGERRESNREFDISKVRCFNCQGYGHYADQCTKPPTNEKPARAAPPKPKIENKKCTWCIAHERERVAHTHNASECRKRIEMEEKTSGSKPTPTPKPVSTSNKRVAQEPKKAEHKTDGPTMNGVRISLGDSETDTDEDHEEYFAKHGQHNMRSKLGLVSTTSVRWHTKEVLGHRTPGINRATSDPESDRVGRLGLRACVGGVKMEFTIDTGCDDINCISERVFKKFPKELRDKLDTSVCVVPTGVEGDPLEVLGSLEVELLCKGQERKADGSEDVVGIPITVHVLKRMHVWGILGMEFLIHHTQGIHYNSSANKNERALHLLDGTKVRVELHSTPQQRAAVQKMYGENNVSKRVIVNDDAILGVGSDRQLVANKRKSPASEVTSELSGKKGISSIPLSISPPLAREKKRGGEERKRKE